MVLGPVRRAGRALADFINSRAFENKRMTYYRNKESGKLMRNSTFLSDPSTTRLERFYYSNPNVAKGLKTMLVAFAALMIVAAITAAVITGLHFGAGYKTWTHIATWMHQGSLKGFNHWQQIAIGGSAALILGLGTTFTILALKDRSFRKSQKLEFVDY